MVFVLSKGQHQICAELYSAATLIVLILKIQDILFVYSDLF